MFVSDFTAMKNTVEIIEALRYKLRMFGVTIDGSTNIFCDSGAVCVNTTRPGSTISNKSSQYFLILRAIKGFDGNGQSAKEAYIKRLGRPIHQDNGSTKYRGNNGKNCILRSELEYVGFLP